MDDDDYVIVASINLSSAFDLVDIDLLLKRLWIVGLPSNLIDLISAWLKTDCITLGTFLGFILGPILCAIFTSPLFDVENMLTFANDN